MTRFPISRFLVGVLATALAAGAARADWALVDGFAGHTVLADGPGANPGRGDGVVNFAVFQRTAGDDSWVDFFGFPPGRVRDLWGGDVDVDCDYVYFYTVVNSDPDTAGEGSLRGFDLPDLAPDAFTSAGYIFRTIFKDADGNVGPPANQILGPSMAGVDVYGDHAPGDGSQTNVDIQETGDPKPWPVDPTEVLREDELLKFVFGSAIPFNPDGYSALLYVTSNYGPVYDVAVLRDGDNAYGDVPVPNPEPATLALLLVGAPFALAYRLRKRARQAG